MILMCVILLILQRISITNIILSNNAYGINIACLLLRRSVQFWVIYTWWLFPFFPFFLYLFMLFCCLFCFVLLVPLNGIKKYLARPDQSKRWITDKPNGKRTAKSQQSKSLQQINNGDNRRLSINCAESIKQGSQNGLGVGGERERERINPNISLLWGSTLIPHCGITNWTEMSNSAWCLSHDIIIQLILIIIWNL